MSKLGNGPLPDSRRRCSLENITRHVPKLIDGDAVFASASFYLPGHETGYSVPKAIANMTVVMYAKTSDRTLEPVELIPCKIHPDSSSLLLLLADADVSAGVVSTCGYASVGAIVCGGISSQVPSALSFGQVMFSKNTLEQS